MKSTELRIGNIVNYGHGRPPQVITKNDLCQGVEDRPFNPIELSSEWLLKFGFQIRTIDYNLGADNYPCYEIFLLTPFTYDNYLRCNAKLNRWCIIQKIHDSDEEADWCEIMFSLKYVHQLQNLYFSLTGKELELKQ